MLDTLRIKSRISELRERILIMRREFSVLPEEKLTHDEVLYTSAERNLEIAIQACLDIAAYINSIMGLKRPKHRSAEVFINLADEKVIDSKLANIMVKIIGYRNILVHEYLKIDRHQTYLNIQKGLDDLENFGKQIEDFLVKQKKP